jgi:SWI/SNF-related matrix-associated actin-dependent regulator 1 of chromatin subfamily A
MLTGKAKIKGIKDYLAELLENDIKFIFFAHHMLVLDEVE